jgi:hypothetical protein
MENKSAKTITSTEACFVRKVNLSLAPESEYSRRTNQLPKVFMLRKSRATNCSSTHNQNISQIYSITYIGDKAGQLSISSRKSIIPKLSHRQISQDSKFRNIAPNYFNQNPSEHKIHQYFRPKPLTPASLKLRHFQQKYSPAKSCLGTNMEN